MEKALTDAPSEQEVAEVLYGLSAFKELHFIVRRLAFERDRLRTALKKANDQAEHFEREWYLRGDELELLRAENAELRADAERLDWCQNQWQDGVHVEVCSIGSGEGIPIHPAAKVFYGAKETNSFTTIRAAIDAARNAGSK